jgi:glycosyltransferase involved in cell wall biosynthesis
MLRRCLASLRRQQLDPGRLQMKLVLIDNNPEPAARAIYDDLFGSQGPLGFVHCPRPGIPMARNAALEAALSAGAEYIAFLDDDEVAPPHWLGSIMQALEDSRADAVQGSVGSPPLSEEALATCAPVPRRKPARAAEVESLATCNVLFKAHLVEPPLALRFDEAMQFTGGSDREFFMRAHKRGAKLVRVDGADVFEEIPESRRSLGYQASRAFAGGSNYFLRMCKNEPGLVAALRITLRALDGCLGGLAKLALSAGLLLALRPGTARAQWRKGCKSLCFAAGCVTPVAGVRAYPYRHIQGA